MKTHPLNERPYRTKDYSLCSRPNLLQITVDPSGVLLAIDDGGKVWRYIHTIEAGQHFNQEQLAGWYRLEFDDRSYDFNR